MTIKELYEWAVKNQAENLDLKLYDRYSEEYEIEPVIETHNYSDGSGTYKEVGL